MPESEEWFTLDEISKSTSQETLYCLAVDSPEKQFLAGYIAAPTHNTDEGKEQDLLKGEAATIIGSIARLGRAAGVHLVVATQRPDASTIAGETKANLGARINCGRSKDSTASSMVLGNGEGTRIKPNPRGRLYVDLNGSGNHGQGFFAGQEWIDEWLEEQGLNPDGSPLNNKRSRLANITDMNQFEETDLDEREGVDNKSVIESIREEESNEDYDELMGSGSDGEDDSQESEPSSSQSVPEGDGIERPKLDGAKDKGDRFARPEDDWDTELEDLIEENN